jgi:hypothetical protein
VSTYRAATLSNHAPCARRHRRCLDLVRQPSHSCPVLIHSFHLLAQFAVHLFGSGRELRAHAIDGLVELVRREPSVELDTIGEVIDELDEQVILALGEVANLIPSLVANDHHVFLSKVEANVPRTMQG